MPIAEGEKRRAITLLSCGGPRRTVLAFEVRLSLFSQHTMAMLVWRKLWRMMLLKRMKGPRKK